MKIGIIYPERDWTAADLALRLEVFAFEKDIDVYISPRHTVRLDENIVLKKLNSCHYVIFIAHDIMIPDEVTLNELKQLKKPFVIALLPDNFQLKNMDHLINENRLHVLTYQQGRLHERNLKELIDEIFKTFKEKDKQKEKVRKNEEFQLELLKALLLVGLSVLIFSALRKN